MPATEIAAGRLLLKEKRHAVNLSALGWSWIIAMKKVAARLRRG
jgi:hypothetical protein